MGNLLNVSDAKAPRLRESTLRIELRTRLLDAKPDAKASVPQLDWMERVIRYLSRVQRRDGDRILRSVPQISKGLGLPVEGLTTRQVRDRWENQITNALGYLELAGFVDHVERDLRRSNGEGIGIVVVLPAGVAQSVRASRSSRVTPDRRTVVRSARVVSRASFCTEVPPPVGGLQGGGDSLAVSSSRREKLEAVGARERAFGTRDRACLSTDVRAALRKAVADMGIEEACGAAVLRAVPALASVPVDIVAREAWRLFGRRGADPRLSLRMAERLGRAAAQIERTGYVTVEPGAGASRAAVIDLALGDWAEHWDGGVHARKKPQTLGGLAVCVRRLAHRLVRGARQRRRLARAPR